MNKGLTILLAVLVIILIFVSVLIATSFRTKPVDDSQISSGDDSFIESDLPDVYPEFLPKKTGNPLTPDGEATPSVPNKSGFSDEEYQAFLEALGFGNVLNETNTTTSKKETIFG